MLLAIGGTSSGLVLQEIASELLQLDSASVEQALVRHSLGTSAVVLIVAHNVRVRGGWSGNAGSCRPSTSQGVDDGAPVRRAHFLGVYRGHVRPTASVASGRAGTLLSRLETLSRAQGRG